MQWLQNILFWFGFQASTSARSFAESWSRFLEKSVTFYRQLSDEEKRVFQQRVLLFLDTTEIVGYGVDISDDDRLLV
ncbi:MAG: zinc-dependent peptidase, partial [Pseudomonadales bacterium]|nr:zinc-dependent peptidase [Pseudomonadales bacterium]